MKNLIISIKLTLIFGLLLGVGYVLVLWTVAQVCTPDHGSFARAELNGKVVGASNVGQRFTSHNYFWGRPSAIDYDGSHSGGSNCATSNPQYITTMADRTKQFIEAHPYLERKKVPLQMVTASGSGLDPHIQPEAAHVQIGRIAKARRATTEQIAAVIDSVTEGPFLGLFGPSVVNVLELNIALDKKFPVNK